MISREALQRSATIPDAIIEDCGDYWRVCFKPDHGGIIMVDPQLINKAALFQSHPHIVEMWEGQQNERRMEAQRIEDNINGFNTWYNSDAPDLTAPNPPNTVVACDQRLLPGMTLHSGELRECTSHQSEHGPFQVCQGCRVQHQQQTVDSDKHKAVATSGARVPVCVACATEALEQHGVNHRGCTCVGEWTCYDCREAKLAEFSRARRHKYAEGRCGICLHPADLVNTADVCLKCDKLSTYAHA